MEKLEQDYPAIVFELLDNAKVRLKKAREIKEQAQYLLFNDSKDSGKQDSRNDSEVRLI